MKQNRNIDEIHLYFNQINAQLKAREQSINNMHTILFEAYLQGVPDATFHDYMRRLQDDWMDQTGDMQAMHLLVNSGKWAEKFPDQEKIIALESQVKELKDLKLSAQLLNKLKEDRKGKVNKSRVTSQDEKTDGTIRRRQKIF